MQSTRSLRFGAAMTVLVGTGLVLAASLPGSPGLATMLGWVAFQPPLAVSPATAFGMGIAGATTAGWGATLWALASARELDWAAVGRAVIIGVSYWFVLDGTVSIVTGFGGNALSNLAFVALLIPPALAMLRHRAPPHTALRTAEQRGT